jgi:tetratricopeptide (TPR) repeat protein
LQPAIQRLRNPRLLVPLAIVIALGVGLLLWATIFQSQSDQERAEAALEEGLEAHAAGDLEAAEEAYVRVIELDPQNKFAYYNLGVIEQGRGELGRAESRYRTAIGIDPRFVAALFNLAILRAEAGATAEAIELYETIIEVEPENAGAHLNLGFLLIERGDTERGRAELEQAIQLDPSLQERIDPALLDDEPAATESPAP